MVYDFVKLINGVVTADHKPSIILIIKLAPIYEPVGKLFTVLLNPAPIAIAAKNVPPDTVNIFPISCPMLLYADKSFVTSFAFTLDVSSGKYDASIINIALKITKPNNTLKINLKKYPPLHA